MSTEDQVLVIGGEPGVQTDEPGPPRRRFLRMATPIGVVVALFAVAVVLADPESDLEPAEPAGLAAPEEPPVDAPPAQAPDPQAAWAALELPGAGVITTVVHGPPGWVVVSLGETTRVLTSVDGRRWSETSLGAPAVGAFLPMASSGAGVLTVVGGIPGDSERFTSWVSDDAGANWTQVPFPEDALTVHSVSDAPVGTYATGTRRAVGGGSEPVVWWLVGGPRWEPLAVQSDGGAVVDLVNASGVAAAIGYEDGPAVWVIRGRQFVPVRISLPEEASASRPLAAVLDGRGRVVVLARRGPANGPLQILRSADLRNWELVADELYTSATTLGRFEGDPVVVGDSVVRITDEGPVAVELPDSMFPLGIDSRRDLSIAAGAEGDGTARLWSSRSGVAPEQPVLLGGDTAPEAPDGWREVASAPGRVVGVFPSDELRPRAVAAEHAVLVSAAHGPVLEILPGDWALAERPRARMVLDVGEESWVVGWDSVDRVGVDGLQIPVGWASEPPVAAAVVDGTTVAAVPGGAVLGLGDRGGWRALGPAPEPASAFDLRGGPGAIFARDSFEPRDVQVWAGDGWEPVPTVMGSSPSGDQFLVTAASPDGTVIEIIDDWPSVTTLEVPARYPLEVVRVGGEVRVRTPTEVLVTADGGGAWVRHPVEGLRATTVLLPTPDLAIAAFAPDRTRILVADR